MDNLSRILSQYEWEKSESVNSFSSPWLWFLSSSIRQGSGLKIHVSAGLDCAPKAALVLNSFCREHSIAFKICRDLTYLSNLNMGFLDQSQVGKFATLYPSGDKDTPAIVSSLIPTLSKIKGPTPLRTTKSRGQNVYRTDTVSFPPLIREILDGPLYPFQIQYKIISLVFGTQQFRQASSSADIG